MDAKDVISALTAHASSADAVFLQRFFKTGEGQYGAGDVFMGVRMPQIRLVARQFAGLPLGEVQKLVQSPVHEQRMCGLVLLANAYAKSDAAMQEKIFQLYLKNLRAGRINNWDLIDVTAEFVIGAHELHTDRHVLFELAASPNLWQKRAAIVSAFQFVKAGDGTTTLQLAEKLLHDRHDLIQKAVGWQLREVGKRVNRQLLLTFLDVHAATMPRTTLRYAIEHLPAAQRQQYMQKRLDNQS